MRKLIYFILPIALLILPYVFFAFFDGAAFYFAKESGAVENITAVLLLLALVLTLNIFFQYRKKTKLLKLAPKMNISYRKITLTWLIIYALGCIYFLGEEISWGQHLFNWPTPEAWMAVNDQKETNLHNSFTFLDQVPRVLLSLAIVIGGLFYPLFNRKKEGNKDISTSFLALIMPSSLCVTAASVVLLISVHDKLYGLFQLDMPTVLQINDGEVKESLIAMFILVYIFDFYYRMKEKKYV